MIVRELDGWMYLVPQAEHARHAALLTGYLRPEFLGPSTLRDQVVAATRHHDEGWTHWERDPARGEDGWPLNFDSIDTREHLRIWERSVVEACRQSGAGAGAMVARHAAQLTGLHDEKAAATFHVMGEALRREAWPKLEQEAAEARLEQSFRALFFGDAASLLALVGWEEKLDLCLHGSGGKGHALQGRRAGEWEVEVSPWPFARAELPLLPVRAWRLPAEADPNKLLRPGWQSREKLLTIGTRIAGPVNQAKE